MSALLRRVSVAAAVLLLTGVPGTAIAGEGLLPTTVAPNPAAPGEDFTVSGPPDCITGGTVLYITVRGTVEGQIEGPDLVPVQTVSGDADWSVTFTVPTDAEPGDYFVRVSGEECAYNDAVLTVALAEPVSPPAVAAEEEPDFTG